MILGDLVVKSANADSSRFLRGTPVLRFTTPTPRSVTGGSGGGQAEIERGEVEELRAACDRFLAGEAIR